MDIVLFGPWHNPHIATGLDAMEAAPYANLLPELLLSLVGHTGDAFLPGGGSAIVLSDEVDWVTGADRWGQRGKQPPV